MTVNPGGVPRHGGCDDTRPVRSALRPPPSTGAEGVMTLNDILTAMRVPGSSEARARQLAHMGYLEWLGALPGGANYAEAAVRALVVAAPLREDDPAVTEFCRLLEDSLNHPLVPLTLIPPRPGRRGGARGRRPGQGGAAPSAFGIHPRGI